MHRNIGESSRRVPKGSAGGLNGEAPKIVVEEVNHRRGDRQGIWQFEWRIENLGHQSLTLLAARLPHGRFRSDERRIEGGIRIAPGDAAVVEMQAACREEPGTVIENAFAIILVEWSGARWRIFVRFLVKFDEQGIPHTTTELITTQKVGFSGVVD